LYSNIYIFVLYMKEIFKIFKQVLFKVWKLAYYIIDLKSSITKL